MPTVRYFLGWNGYQIPINPAKEAKIEDALVGAAFYIGTFDDTKRLVKWEKIFVRRIQLPSTLVTGENAEILSGFYGPVPNSDPKVPDFTRRLPDSEVPRCPYFFQVETRGPAKTLTLSQLTLTAGTVDSYTYHATGKLAHRDLRREDGRITSWDYGSDGQVTSKVER